MSARARGSSMERQASSENPVTDLSMNRLRTGTLPSWPAEAPNTTARPSGASSPMACSSTSPPTASRASCTPPGAAARTWSGQPGWV